MAYENPTATALQDRQTVENTAADVIEYLRLQTEANWCDTWQQQKYFIQGLFDQYAPEVSQQERQIASLLGATGLTFIAERYGVDEHHPKFYSGSYEQRVLATYHHLGHSAGFVENAFIHGSAINRIRPNTYGPGAFMRFPIIGAFHDPIMGNGRGNDERQSAMLGAEMFMRCGFSLMPDEAIYEGILATTFKNMKQCIDPSRPHLEYQLVSGVADLLPLNTRKGPYQTICCIVEDMTKKIHGQVLTRVANDENISLAGAGVEDCLDITDRSDTLHAAFGKILVGQTAFYKNFSPADPYIDTLLPGRPENHDFMNMLTTSYAAERIGARETLTLAKEYELA